VEERLARWLLMTHDRADGDTLPLTQEFLATMLGVRRAGVSVAASALQKAGLIAYAQGQITVLDRAGLEAAACECHGVVRRQYERLLGWPAGE
jgi:CRP-like cAMP-binding protein